MLKTIILPFDENVKTISPSSVYYNHSIIKTRDTIGTLVGSMFLSHVDDFTAPLYEPINLMIKNADGFTECGFSVYTPDIYKNVMTFRSFKEGFRTVDEYIENVLEKTERFFGIDYKRMLKKIFLLSAIMGEKVPPSDQLVFIDRQYVQTNVVLNTGSDEIIKNGKDKDYFGNGLSCIDECQYFFENERLTIKDVKGLFDKFSRISDDIPEEFISLFWAKVERLKDGINCYGQ